MFTNYDYLKDVVNDRNRLVNYLAEHGSFGLEAMTGICDTSNCPYLDNCNAGRNAKCQLDDKELIDIWLTMEHK